MLLKQFEKIQILILSFQAQYGQATDNDTNHLKYFVQVSMAFQNYFYSIFYLTS